MVLNESARAVSVSFFLSYVCVCVYLSGLTIVRDRVFYLSRGNFFDVCVCACVCVYTDVFLECARGFILLTFPETSQSNYMTITVFFQRPFLMKNGWSV